MLYALLIPFLIGAFSVWQNTYNRRIAGDMGLPLALVVNNVILLALGLLLYFLVRLYGENSLPEIFQQKGGLAAFTWKCFLPGIFGFFIIAAAPVAIAKVGASRVFIGIIAAQIVFSLLWDSVAESVPVTPLRMLGAFLALAGAFLATR
jgi:uncharacterized membrane protein YdcZ (DUF606 family)